MAIDADRRVPHLPCSVLEYAGKSARETIDAKRYKGIAGGQ